jgi:hypothetical protein
MPLKSPYTNHEYLRNSLTERILTDIKISAAEPQEEAATGEIRKLSRQIERRLVSPIGGLFAHR